MVVRPNPYALTTELSGTRRFALNSLGGLSSGESRQRKVSTFLRNTVVLS